MPAACAPHLSPGYRTALPALRQSWSKPKIYCATEQTAALCPAFPSSRPLQIPKLLKGASTLRESPLKKLPALPPAAGTSSPHTQPRDTATGPAGRVRLSGGEVPRGKR